MKQVEKQKINGNIFQIVANKVKSLFSLNNAVFA